MRIGIDTRELTGRPTGVGRYLGELLGAWADPAAGVAERCQFVLYGPSALPPGAAARSVNCSQSVPPRPGSTRTEGRSAAARAETPGGMADGP